MTWRPPGLGALAAGLMLAGLCSARAAEPAPGADAGSTTVAAEPDETRRMSVPVFVNDQGPFPFLVDTAADATVVSDRLAARLQLQSAGGAVLHSISGPTAVETVRIDRLRVSDRSVSDITAAALKEDDLGASGLLGIDSLRDQRMTLDFRARVMTITPGEKQVQTARRRPGEVDVVVVRARPYAGQLVLTDARIEGTPVRVVIDTGSERTIANLALRRELARKRPDDPARLLLVGVDGEGLMSDVAIVPALTIGGLTVRNVPLAFVDAHPFRRFRLDDTPAMLLGMDVLSQLDQVSVDFASRSVRFVLAARR